MGSSIYDQQRDVNFENESFPTRYIITLYFGQDIGYEDSLSLFFFTILVQLKLNIQFYYFKALNQNAELRSRLNRIHSDSVLCDQVVSVNIIPSPDEVRLWHCSNGLTIVKFC